jgi:uncharacterized protein
MSGISQAIPVEIVLWVGAALVLLALAQAATALYGSLKRNRFLATQQNLAIRSLNADIELKNVARSLEASKLSNRWSGLRKFRINRKVMEGGGICSFYLVPHDGKPLPQFEPGQYLTFNLQVPDQNKPVVRCYSLSDSPYRADQYYRVSIKHQGPPPKEPDAPPGLSSTFFHQNLDVGDILDVRAPGGNFYLDQTKTTPVVLIGGGVGLTPVLSMLTAIIDSRSKREVWFFYGMRSGEDHIMREQLQQINEQHDNVHLVICYSNPREGIDKPGRDYHHSGHVSVEHFKTVLPSNNFDFYICGPPPMMESLVRDLDAWGVPESSVHFEAFGPASVKKKSAPAASESAGEVSASAIKVEFAKSGKSFDWLPENGTLLEFGESHGISMDSGCRAGSCGTCKTAVRTGQVGYLDEPSGPMESGSCLPCVAIPKSALSIDA